MAYNSDKNRHIQPVLSSVAVRMADCVKIKINGEVTRLRSLTVGNLATIFKLDVNQGICIYVKKEIIIPTEAGFFNVEDYAKTCNLAKISCKQWLAL